VLHPALDNSHKELLVAKGLQSPVLSDYPVFGTALQLLVMSQFRKNLLHVASQSICMLVSKLCSKGCRAPSFTVLRQPDYCMLEDEQGGVINVAYSSHDTYITGWECWLVIL
jgi:hypothetical protein